MHESVSKALELSGHAFLNPAQQAAVDAGLLEGKNMVVAAPTASGKTLIAEIAALDAVRKNRKVLYIVPLKALASEKYDEFTRKYSPLGIRVAISVGDRDSSDPWLASKDIIIITSEKLDSLMRHGINWLSEVGLVIADEIHLLNDPGRGPTLEVTLTRLRQEASPLILGLSATISNYEELAKWLEAVPVFSGYRPVRLYSGVCDGAKVEFFPERKLKLPEGEPLAALVMQALKKKKQALVFIGTRKGTEAAAEKMSGEIRPGLAQEEAGQLLSLAEKAGSVLEHPTIQCRRLAGCIRSGTAFHHAGLAAGQRKLVEGAFRNGKIKVIFCTPTLAAGLNLPAWRVIIRDLKRFSSVRGMDYLPVLEVQQMLGRSGRPAYDSEGEGILLAKNRGEAEFFWDNYIKGTAEDVQSKLGVEPVLRTHVLALIASGMTPNKNSLMEFFSRTFYSHQYGDAAGIESMIDKVLAMLGKWGFVGGSRAGQHEDNPFRRASELASVGSYGLSATLTGKRVAELYIDPLTANYLLEKLGVAEKNNPSDFSLLHVMCRTLEMSPPLAIRKGDREQAEAAMEESRSELLDLPPASWDAYYEEYLGSIKTAMMLTAWMDEAGEDALFEQFGVSPGELRSRLDIADWIAYSMAELALLTGRQETMKALKKLRLRMKYGIRKELLPLIRLKGIGRVRARKLFGSGFRSLDDLRRANESSLAKVVGTATAAGIKKQLGEPLEEELPKGVTLNDFDGE
jgi:helicase